MTNLVREDGTVDWGKSPDSWEHQDVVRGLRRSNLTPAPGPHEGHVCLHVVATCKIDVLPGTFQDAIVTVLLHLAEACEPIEE